jgi:hypothetical protein
MAMTGRVLDAEIGAVVGEVASQASAAGLEIDAEHAAVVYANGVTIVHLPIKGTLTAHDLMNGTDVSVAHFSLPEGTVSIASGVEQGTYRVHAKVWPDQREALFTLTDLQTQRIIARPVPFPVGPINETELFTINASATATVGIGGVSIKGTLSVDSPFGSTTVHFHWSHAW